MSARATLAHLITTDAARHEARAARLDAFLAGFGAGLLLAGEAACRGWQLQAASAAEAWLDPDILTDAVVQRVAKATDDAHLTAVELRRHLLEVGATALLAAALGPEIDGGTA